MIRQQDDVLRQIARIARSGHRFFSGVYPALTDPELRTAFTYIIDVKKQFLVDLAPWLVPADDAIHDAASPAIAAERIYDDLRRRFKGNFVATSAHELGFGEARLLELVERAFDVADDADLKRLLKGYYPQLIICREAMWRLSALRVA